MDEILEVKTEAGDVLFFEIEQLDGREVKAGAGSVVNKSRETLENALASVRPFALAAKKALDDVSPHEIEFEFGVRLSIEGGLLFVKNATEGHFRVTVKWKGATSATHGE